MLKRKRVISLFSKHCKERGWGKVLASQQLANYLYSGMGQEEEQIKESFARKWVEILDAVINKPSKTTLKKYEELFNYINCFVIDLGEEAYFSEIEDIALGGVRSTFEFLSDNLKMSTLKPIRHRITEGLYGAIRQRKPIFEPYYELEIIPTDGGFWEVEMFYRYSFSTESRKRIIGEKKSAPGPEGENSLICTLSGFLAVASVSVETLSYEGLNSNRSEPTSKPTVLKGIMLDRTSKKFFYVEVHTGWGENIARYRKGVPRGGDSYIKTEPFEGYKEIRGVIKVFVSDESLERYTFGDKKIEGIFFELIKKYG